MKYDQVTTNFNEYEGRCRGENCCGHSSSVHTDVWEALQELRGRLNKKIILTCGFRCQKHNRTIRSSRPTSQHCKGTAVDFVIPKMNHIIVLEECKKLFKGVGYYPKKNMIHVDLRRGRKTRW